MLIRKTVSMYPAANEKSNAGESLVKQTLDDAWLPVFNTCQSLLADERPEIQKRALDLLFEILKKHGALFDQQFWKTIFKGVLKPLIDNINFLFQ